MKEENGQDIVLLGVMFEGLECQTPSGDYNCIDHSEIAFQKGANTNKFHERQILRSEQVNLRTVYNLKSDFWLNHHFSALGSGT
jgi:hypothetical protein